MKKQIILSILLLLIFPINIFAASSLSDRLAGRILLQVEQNGEAWYVEPTTKQRAYLGRPADAFRIMRGLGLGIAEYDYSQFKVRTPQHLSGRILLRVEANGEAYYVHPENLKLIYLGRPADAFRVMREQGMGITNDDLNSLPLNEKYAVSDEIKQKIVDFINNSLMQPGSAATIKDIIPEGEMYKIIVVLSGGQEIISYTDKAVTKFFPQAMDMNKPKEKSTPSSPAVNLTELQKTDKPSIELFVMSHCPYGVQMEKAILPVIKLLGESIDFEVKFVNYAMHGKIEVDEQLRQYCIQKNDMSEHLVYLECFLADGDSEKCLGEANIKSEALDNCISETDQEFGITASYEDKSTWHSGKFPIFNIHQSEVEQYGVKGSPTFIINSKKVNVLRNPQALLDTICSAFNLEPAECSTEISTVTPSAGFGYAVNGSNTNASCGS